MSQGGSGTDGLPGATRVFAAGGPSAFRLAVFASGRGSNLEAILAADLPAVVAVVVSNVPSARALEVARSHSIPTLAVDHRGLTREQHEQELIRRLKAYEPLDLIVLAGYMRIFTPLFLNRFAGRVVNIHPSLLPEFPGTDAYRRAFEAGLPESGVTVHRVEEAVDAGPILAQERFARLPEDTLESFTARGLALEHRLYPEVLRRLALAAGQRGSGGGLQPAPKGG